jgi:ribosomal protein S8
LDNDDPLTQMFNRIYEANQTGLDRIQAKATPLTRQIADSLLTQHIIDQIEMDETQTDVMILYLPATSTSPPQFGPVNYLQEFPTDDPEKIKILQKLQDPDPNIRIQGIHALRDRCLELA